MNIFYSLKDLIGYLKEFADRYKQTYLNYLKDEQTPTC